ncbi:uncharacterized protein lrif1 [Paramisgurnus dabryanus]|uniref:uncharacterized protein lrif1 n=1 Tax=Paramisgurnus dabryanus TaxID=90735 RepID=UPI0031F3D8E8
MEGGTGVYYQAMPAVGPDGKNVMKLIPVQKVNGQFFQTMFNTEMDNVELQVKGHPKPVYPSVASSSQSQTRLPSLQPIADGRYVLKTSPQLSTLFNSPKVQHNGTKILHGILKPLHPPLAKPTVHQSALQNKPTVPQSALQYALQSKPTVPQSALQNALQNNPTVTQSVLQNVLQNKPTVYQSALQNALQNKPTVYQNALQNNGHTMPVVQTLPVTVKSPVLPNGHCLQIPPYAQVRTLPASALPQSIKSQILNSVSITPTNAKVQPTFLMVSPVNSVKLNSDQQVFSVTKPSQVQKTLSQHLPSNTGTSSPLSSLLSSKISEEQSRPIKWIVQEEMGASGPCLVPASSPQMNPITIKSVKHVESVSSSSEVVSSKPTPAQIGQEKITQGKDNALVMCNGKVYFVAKKNSEIAKDVMVSEGGRKGYLCISPALPASSALGSNSSKATIDQDPKRKVSEIIDLCDDEEESSTSLGGASGNLPTQSQTEVDESNEDSNVIFVSYIPPKSETTASEKGTNCASRNERKDVAPPEMEINEKSATQSEREETTHAGMEIDGVQENTAARQNNALMDIQVQVNVSAPAERNASSLLENVNTEEEEQLERGIPPITTDIPNGDDAAVGETVNTRDDVLGDFHYVCVPATDNTEKTFGNLAPDQKTQEKSDCQLRKEFGITSDVQICVEKIRETEKQDRQAEKLIINKRTLDGLRKVIQESQLQSKIQKIMQVTHKNTEDDEGLKEVKRKKLEQDGEDVPQDNPSLITTNVSSPSKRNINNSVFPMENSLILQTCQEDVCSSSYNTDKIAVSTVSKVHMQSETSTDLTSDTCCLTPSSEPNVTRTSTHTIPHSSALRKASPRSKKSKMCTACPCGTVLGVTATSSSLQSQETQPVVVESNKGTRTTCCIKTPGESPQPIGDHSTGKKAKKQRSSRKKKSPSTKTISKISHRNASPDSLLNVTTSMNAASLSGLQESDKAISPSSNETECNISPSSHTEDHSSEQDASQVQIISNETGMPSSSEQHESIVNTFTTQDLYSVEVLDAEEIKRQERIKRLKDLLKEKEAALERMRQSMNF